MPRKKESVTNPFEKGAAAAKSKRVRQEKLAQGEDTSQKERDPVTTETKPETVGEELVTANFKIPASYRKKLKMYAVANDTTTVAVLKEMIDKLPDV